MRWVIGVVGFAAGVFVGLGIATVLHVERASEKKLATELDAAHSMTTVVRGEKEVAERQLKLLARRLTAGTGIAISDVEQAFRDLHPTTVHKTNAVGYPFSQMDIDWKGAGFHGHFSGPPADYWALEFTWIFERDVSAREMAKALSAFAACLQRLFPNWPEAKDWPIRAASRASAGSGLEISTTDTSLREHRLHYSTEVDGLPLLIFSVRPRAEIPPEVKVQLLEFR